MSFNQRSLNKLGLGGGQIPFPGTTQFGQTSSGLFGDYLGNLRNLETQLEGFGFSPERKEQIVQGYLSNMPSASDRLVEGILADVQRKGTKEYQEEQLELADKYQTRKGIRQTAFNMFGSGMDNLMKGIGMSMNPYGTPEGLQNYLALTVAAPQAMSEGYRNLRTPMAIPAVQAPGAPTYF